MTRKPAPDHADPMLRLRAIMARLRDPDGGCPWDLEQSFRTIAPYTIEEAYEVADAIERRDWASLRGELGDLLFQVVYYAQMAEENGWWAFDDVADAVAQKMVARHPHVFSDADERDADSQTIAWEAQKAVERKAKALASDAEPSILDDLPRAFSWNKEAQVALQRGAARVGFDWRAAADIFDKLDEEAAEAKAAAQGGARAEIEDELGDLLFVCVNLCRRYDVDPEMALRACNAKFEGRFRWIEETLRARGEPIEAAGIDKLDELWREAKSALSNQSGEGA